MKKVLLSLLGCCFFVACEPANDQPPIGHVQMKTILTDINYAEVYSTMVNDSLQEIMNKNKDSLAVYYKDILVHHGITMDELINGMKWYQSHPEELEKVYQDMIPEIATQQDIEEAKQ